MTPPASTKRTIDWSIISFHRGLTWRCCSLTLESPAPGRASAVTEGSIAVIGSRRESVIDMRRSCSRNVPGALVIGLVLACVAPFSSVQAASHPLLQLVGRLESAVEPSVWCSSGKAGFEGSNDTLSWRLEYPLDGWMAEVRAEFSLPFDIGRRRVATSVRVRYAHSLGIDGTSTDLDWDRFGGTRGYSEADCEADAIMWDTDAIFSVEIHQERIPVALEVGVVAGYGVQRFEFTDKDLHTTVWHYHSVDLRFPGVAAYYDMEVRTGRLGVLADLRARERLQCHLEATYVPYLEANADALWLLVGYPFWQHAKGRGYTLTFKSSYAVWNCLSLFAGVRRVSLVADDDGVEGGVYGGIRYEDEPMVSEIMSKYSGIEVGAALRF